MNSILETALAGMARNLRGIEIAAQNVANVNTDGYHTQRNNADGDASTSPDPTSNTSEATILDLPTSDVDLATEFVNLKLHEIGYQANGLLIKVADRLTKETLDLLA